MSAVIGRRVDFSSKVAGFTVAVVLHGAAIWSMAAFQDPATSAFDAASGGLTVMIGEAGGAQEIGEVGAAQAEGVVEGTAEEVTLEQAPPVEMVQSITDTTVPVETAPIPEAVETVVAETVPAEPVEVSEPVEPAPVVAEAVEVPVVEAETVQAVSEPVAPAPVPQLRPEPKPQPVTAAVAVPPRPVKAVEPVEAKAAKPDPAPSAEPASERSVAEKKKGSGAFFDAAASSPTLSTTAGTLQAASGGGGAAGARKSYLASLQSWLERHKKYPRAARLRRYEGTVQFRFLIDRAGSVLEHSIVESSGKRVLDEAVLELLKRANPMPSMPPEIGGATLELTTSIDFRLR
ncbi:energy transducer TonB [Nisaea sediminum]|uniref:energy transducer TonB n=1 Tax=Nisaea sediminum TaxID=2775867 RepID=UPI001868E20A|nr:energy transducer TonB [Nisaea sediminum]